MKTRIWILVGLLFPFVAFAQKDSISFPEIEIHATSLKSSNNNSDHEWNSNQIDNSLSNNLATFLNSHSSVFIKNYGPNTLATSSLSGGNASQTIVYWNDLPINNPMLGLLDLSLISVNSMENISVSSTGNSSLWGNGNIGGGVFLNNKISSEKIHLKSAYNSIDQFTNYFAFNNSIKKLSTSSKVEYIKGENNYSYTLSNGNKKLLANADVSQLQIMQSIYYPINKNSIIEAHAWLTFAKRGIPPTTQQSISRDSTQDINQKYSIKLTNYLPNNKILKTTAGYFIDDNRYLSRDQKTINRVNTITINSIFDGNISENIKYLLGINNKHLRAETAAYQKRIFQNQFSTYASIKFSRNKSTVKLNLREELIDTYWAPISPSLYVSHKITPSTKISADIARNYRYPSLNDLFWKPGGNANLKAESGWSYNFHIKYNTSIDRWKYNLNGKLYSRIVDDWIMWAKDQNTPFFNAYNIAKVWSRGFQLNGQVHYEFGSNFIDINASYNHTLSTSLREITLPKISKGDQLWYTPISQFNSRAKIGNEFFAFSYNFNYMGKTIGIQENISAYALHDIAISANYLVDNNSFKIILEVNNIFNKSYRVIEYRPMPERNLTIGIQYKLK